MPDVRAGSADGIGEGEISSLEAEGKEIAIAREGDQFYAFQNECTHQYCTFDDADIEDGTVVCACHGSAFDLQTGDVVNPPATEPIEIYPARVDGTDVIVTIE